MYYILIWLDIHWIHCIIDTVVLTSSVLARDKYIYNCDRSRNPNPEDCCQMAAMLEIHNAKFWSNGWCPLECTNSGKNKCQVCIFSIAMNELRMDSVTCCNFDASITCSIQHASNCKNDNSRSEPFSIDRRASDHAFLTLNGNLWKGSEKAQFLTMFLPAEINILGELWNCPCSIYTKHRDIPPTGWPSKPRMQTQWWKTKFYRIWYVYKYLAKMHHRKPQTAWANIEHDCHV